ncbi:hypothetical protein LTS17_005392 [Exophiala oligosperma]
MENIRDPGHNRKKIVHNFLDCRPAAIAYDDEISINTQSSSRWDGLLTRLYYNGLTHDEISGAKAGTRNGIQEWLKAGGVIGRGVLLDYYAWAERKGIRYKPASRHTISEKDLEEVAAAQGTQFLPGDILFVRTGWVNWYNGASDRERVEGCKVHHKYCGVEGTKESIEWLWNHHFAALVADNMSFEAWPAEGPYRTKSPS